ncbi:MAG: hypothetical protein AUI15_11015 [Actinobacteria bacterium 13_2_20CM_2_66_6]|nr:MAG: hypothetical protein AUI15_11015 [Actinobacteria bacterium 13_2_20CM_2_66_6]
MPAKPVRTARTGIVSDPIADMLTRIRNASGARHPEVSVPASRLKLEIARVLKDEGYIAGFEVAADGATQTMRIILGGLGIAILSTAEGVMSGRQALRHGLGGEVLAYVW